MPYLLALQRTAGNQAVTALVQRSVSRAAATVSTPYDLATQILGGQELGITPPVVNGHELPVDAGTAAAATAALRPPTIATTEENGEYTARVTAVPDNTVGAHLKLPRPPPSETNAHPAKASMMLGLVDDKVRHGWLWKSAQPEVLDRRQGQTRVVIEGEPSSAQFHDDIRVHEQHHADDHWAAAAEILGAWDRKLPGLVGRGDSPPAAEAALYKAAGGSPDDLGLALDKDWEKRNNAFHDTTEGRRSDLKGYWIAKDGSTVNAYWGY